MGNRGESLESWFLEFMTGGGEILIVWEVGLYPVGMERRWMAGGLTGSIWIEEIRAEPSGLERQEQKKLARASFR